jgi:hypothetical protein
MPNYVMPFAGRVATATLREGRTPMRHRVSILTVLATVALMVPAVPALAATLVVGTCDFGSGGPATIQGAINVANVGDVILVCPGTYDEQLVINKALTITGSGVGATIVQPTFVPSTTAGHGPAADVHLTTGASGTTIQDISFDFNGSADDRGGWGILLSDFNGPAVTNVTIQNNDIQMGAGPRTTGGAQGLGVTTGKDADISGLVITGNSFHGATTAPAADANRAEGVYLNPNLGSGMMTVSNNTFDGHMFVGVSIESDNVTVTGNTVVNASLTANTRGIRVNDFVGGKTWTSITISDNEVSGFDNGLRLGPASARASSIDIAVRANSITGNTTGIRVQYDTLVTAPLNSIVDNTVAVDAVAGTGTIDAPNSWWGGAAGPTGIGDTTWLTALGLSANPASLTVGGSTTVTATLLNNLSHSVGAAPLEVGFSRTGANPLVSAVDGFSPAEHTYSGANAGTDTIAGRFVVAGVTTTLNQTTTVQWTAAPSGGGGGTGGEATAADPLVVTVTGPTAASAVVTPAMQATVFAAGYSMLGVEFTLEADAATAANPLVITVRIDSSVLPAGVGTADIEVFRDGVLVPDCDVPSGTSAVPDPCVAERTMSGDDVVITIRTSTASVWSFGLATPPGDISFACPAGSVPDPGFTDVGSIGHAAAIECLAWYGITLGTSATTYGPFQEVSRAQMASFLTRMLSDAGVALPANPPDAFGDDADSPHHTAINQLAALGLTLGTTATTYSPQDSVTRAQMAKFLVETYEFVSAASLPRTGNAFNDDDGSPFEPFIDAAAAAGITVGTGPSVYDPTSPVLRSQMASFITRVANRLLVEGFIALP